MHTSQKPEISVVMPVYNGALFIKEAIESILIQTFMDFEFIIIDDGSTDHTIDIINNIKDKRIRLIQNSRNQGNYVVRNIGNKLARGKYIAVMDADDVSIPDRLEIQYHYLERNRKTGLVGSSAEVIDVNNKRIRSLEKPVSYPTIKLFLLRDNCMVHPSVMYRVAQLKKHRISYNEQLKYAADYEFMIACARKFQIANVDQTLIRYRRHGAQISMGQRILQSRYADVVRLKQLSRFQLKCTHQEQLMHLNIMKNEGLNDLDVELASNWCNRLLDSNAKNKIYHHAKLYEFLRMLLYHNLNKPM